MRFGLKEETIQAIRGVLSAFPQVEEALLYGSRAKGNFKPGSDIDITLKGTDLDLTVLNRINQRLDELMLPYVVDISIYNQIDNQDLLGHISRVGVTFYQRP